VARPLHNKCRGRAALEALRQASPAGLCHKPRGSSGSPPEWGAQAHRIRLGQVSAPDPCSCRGPPVPGPCCGPDLTRRDLGPIRGIRHAFLGVPGRNRGFGLYVQGSGVPPWRSGPNDTSWVYHLFLPRGAPRSAYVMGSGHLISSLTIYNPFDNFISSLIESSYLKKHNYC
jgi:hypothetical protein